MNIENLIRKKRSLDYAVEKNNDEEAKKLLNDLIKQYYCSLELCEFEIYYDGGYYRYHNMDLCVSSQNKAEFRVLICPKNNKQLILLKTDNSDWDETILGKKINIVNPFEQDIEEIPIYVLEPYIQNLIYSFSNYDQEQCNHIEFKNSGYYKCENNKIQKSDIENADFRIVTCNCCKKQYLLPKSENPYWDVTLGDKPITVFNKQKVNKQKVFCQ